MDLGASSALPAIAHASHGPNVMNLSDLAQDPVLFCKTLFGSQYFDVDDTILGFCKCKWEPLDFQRMVRVEEFDPLVMGRAYEGDEVLENMDLRAFAVYEKSREKACSPSLLAMIHVQSNDFMCLCEPYNRQFYYLINGKNLFEDAPRALTKDLGNRFFWIMDKIVADAGLKVEGPLLMRKEDPNEPLFYQPVSFSRSIHGKSRVVGTEAVPWPDASNGGPQNHCIYRARKFDAAVMQRAMGATGRAGLAFALYRDRFGGPPDLVVRVYGKAFSALSRMTGPTLMISGPDLFNDEPREVSDQDAENGRLMDQIIKEAALDGRRQKTDFVEAERVPPPKREFNWNDWCDD